MVRSGNTEKVYSLIQQGFDVNTTDQQGATALHVGITEADTADIAMVTLLLKHGANPNQEDEKGKTPLYRALSALHKCWINLDKINTIVQPLLEQIQEKYDRERAKSLENSNGRVNQYDVEAREKKLGLLKTKYEAIIKKIKPAIKRITEQEISYEYTITKLIEHGANTKIPTTITQEAARRYRALLQTIQIKICINAIMADKDDLVVRCLNGGIEASCIVNEIPLLALATTNNAQKTAQLLLYHGAHIATPYPCVLGGDITVLHQAADIRDDKLIAVLLESPQGSPSRTYAKHDLEKARQEIFAFLCCVNKKDASTNMLSAPEVQHNICKFLLPDPANLINEVPLEQLPRYLSCKVFGRSFFKKAAILNALTERHIELVQNALETKSAAPLDLLPHQFARLIVINDNVFLEEPNETSKLLDPAENPLEKRRQTIKANYTKLLE